ncbi:hypothetical protein EVAR_14953_1 [Eumeta japonica]|uniref:Uncharacterized protein n=1 Tax=Eumeta variegata TaxID=151549 RepID=A0A4C1XRC5_EUMVA|nr:hypothetical protein EVAR_14953_1 [Eumeta japonica]
MVLSTTRELNLKALAPSYNFTHHCEPNPASVSDSRAFTRTIGAGKEHHLGAVHSGPCDRRAVDPSRRSRFFITLKPM